MIATFRMRLDKGSISLTLNLLACVFLVNLCELENPAGPS